jgi:hypothetical protein
LSDEIQLEKMSHYQCISKAYEALPALQALTRSHPYLEVTISSDLRGHLHVNNIYSKATRTLNFIRRNIYRCSPDINSLAYSSLVRPHLECAAAAWGCTGYLVAPDIDYPVAIR